VLAAGLGVAVHELGKRDLARMAAGTMDPAGEADTRRAMWWGDVGTVLGFCGVLGCAPLCLPLRLLLLPVTGPAGPRNGEFPPAASY
jgi:hypothetical protein